MQDLEGKGLVHPAVADTNPAVPSDGSDVLRAECIRTFPSATSLLINHNRGWTRLSFNVAMLDMSISTVFQGITSLGSGDHIKNQQDFTDYYVRENCCFEAASL